MRYSKVPLGGEELCGSGGCRFHLFDGAGDQFLEHFYVYVCEFLDIQTPFACGIFPQFGEQISVDIDKVSFALAIGAQIGQQMPARIKQRRINPLASFHFCDVVCNHALQKALTVRAAHGELGAAGEVIKLSIDEDSIPGLLLP